MLIFLEVGAIDKKPNVQYSLNKRKAIRRLKISGPLSTVKVYLFSLSRQITVDGLGYGCNNIHCSQRLLVRADICSFSMLKRVDEFVKRPTQPKCS